MPNDMRHVIAPRSDQLNSDDLIAGPITITVEKVTIRDGTEQPISVHYVGDNGKPYKPGKSMARVMVYAWGAESKNYVGRSMTLYRDPKVTWAGMAVGGIRISHMSHIDSGMEMALRATKGVSKLFSVQPLRDAPQTQSNQSKPPEATGSQPKPETAPIQFNVIDQNGNPHDLQSPEKWKSQIEKIIGKFTKPHEVSAFIVRNDPAIADVAETHGDAADEVRVILMSRKNELEPKP